MYFMKHKIISTFFNIFHHSDIKDRDIRSATGTTLIFYKVKIEPADGVAKHRARASTAIASAKLYRTILLSASERLKSAILSFFIFEEIAFFELSSQVKSSQVKVVFIASHTKQDIRQTSMIQIQ